MQAQLARIYAKGAFGEIDWRAHESRGAAVSYGRLAFSDGNDRDIAQARWTERVIVGPVYKLEVTPGIFASRNTLTDRPYFNPSHDFSPTLEVMNEWLQWRRYTQAFYHRLIGDVGNYWQEHFKDRPLYGVRYEQEWDAYDRVALRYGVGRTWHSYDGVLSERTFGYVALNWRF